MAVTDKNHTPALSLSERLKGYEARLGVEAAYATLGVARMTYLKVRDGKKPSRAIEHLILAGLAADDAARSASANEGKTK